VLFWSDPEKMSLKEGQPEKTLQNYRRGEWCSKRRREVIVSGYHPEDKILRDTKSQRKTGGEGVTEGGWDGCFPLGRCHRVSGVPKAASR